MTLAGLNFDTDEVKIPLLARHLWYPIFPHENGRMLVVFVGI
jgi:hypothetical protein